MTDWIHKVENFKQLRQLFENMALLPEEEQVEPAKKKLSEIIKSNSCLHGINEAPLNKVKTIYGFNQFLNTVYDYADTNRIWLNL